jgi:hypothetical protein
VQRDILTTQLLRCEHNREEVIKLAMHSGIARDAQEVQRTFASDSAGDCITDHCVAA